MQVLYLQQHNSNIQSIKRNIGLHFWQFENEISEITAQFYIRKV